MMMKKMQTTTNGSNGLTDPRQLQAHVPSIGTIVFGGFIIAAVQFAPAILAYVQKQMSGASEKNKVSFVPQ